MNRSCSATKRLTVAHCQLLKCAHVVSGAYLDSIVLAAASGRLDTYVCFAHSGGFAPPYRTGHPALQHGCLCGSLLLDLSGPASLSVGDYAPDTFLACCGSLRICAFASTGHFRQFRDRARDIWLGKVERQQLDAELCAVRHGYIPV